MLEMVRYIYKEIDSVTSLIMISFFETISLRLSIRTSSQETNVLTNSQRYAKPLRLSPKRFSWQNLFRFYNESEFAGPGSRSMNSFVLCHCEVRDTVLLNFTLPFLYIKGETELADT